MEALDPGPNEDPRQLMSQLEHEVGMAEWWTPLHRRRPEPVVPRVTEDGLTVPPWWTDDETESQSWLLAQGVMLE